MLNIRFKDARSAKGYTQHELADLSSSTQSAIYKIETGKTTNPRNLAVFAEKLGVTEEWLRYGIVEGTGLGLDSSGLGEAPRAVFVSIPVYDVSFSAGDGCFFESAEILSYYSISLETLEKYNLNKPDAGVFRVKGESMEPTLHDNDTILVNTSIKKPVGNKIFAFSFDGELKVKRFYHQLDRSWRISSDNEDKNRYRDELVFNGKINEIDIVGQVLTILDRSLVWLIYLSNDFSCN